MYRNFNSLNKIKHSGSALVIAIFVLVIMSLLGSALIRMQSSSAETVVYEVIGTRAYAAAQTGVQWQLSEIFPLNTPGITRCKSPIVEPIINGVNGLDCQFKVICDEVNYDGVQYYTLTSTGTCEVGDVITSRTIKVEARNIN